MKKKAICLTLAACMVLGMTSCGKISTGSDGNSGESGDKVKISFLSRYANDDNRRDQYYLEKVDEFLDENPNVEIEDLSITDSSSYMSKMKTMIAAGDVPDLFICSYEMPRYEMAKNGTIANLEDIINSSDWTGPSDSKWFEGYTFESEGLDGIYGIPNALGTAPLFINKKIFSDLGLEIPKTWEDLEAAAPTLIDAGITPLTVSAKDTDKCTLLFTELAIKMYGPDIIDKFKAKDVDWTDNELMSVLKKYKQLINEGIFGANAVSYGFDNSLSDFSQGKAAMLLEYSFTLPNIQDMDIEPDITCVNFLSFEDKPEYENIWYTDTYEGFCIGAKPGTPEYDAAVGLLTKLLSQDTFNGCAEVMGGGVYPLDVQYDESKVCTFMKEFADAYKSCETISTILPAYIGDATLSDLTASEMQTLFVGRSPEDVAKTLNTEYEKVLQK